MRRREKAAILAEILEALDDQARAGDDRLSAVARTCNMPYDRFREYLAQLQATGHVSPDNAFVLTPEGQRMLSRYREWRESVRLFGMGDETR